MGDGVLRDGRFNLTLSVRHNASAERLDEWRRAFERASLLLFDATDGQHQLGDIRVFNNSAGRNVDAYLNSTSGRSKASIRGLGRRGWRMTIFADERFKPFVLIHEFSHYAYGVYDEYISLGDAAAECVGGTRADTCIMETGWRDGDRFGERAEGGPLIIGRVSEFCVEGNHDPDRDTRQHSKRSESCWQTMTRFFPDLRAPVGLPTGAPPTTATPINWIVSPTERRFIIFVGLTEDASGARLGGANYGARWWVETAVEGDMLGIMSLSHMPASDFPLRVITGDSDRTSVREAISNISAGSTITLSDGLGEALGNIRGAGPRAATQAIVLLTDSARENGEDHEVLLSALRDEGLSVYAIGVGPDVNVHMLNDIVTATCGRFHRIDPLLPEADQQFAITNSLIEISGEARENTGLVTTHRDVLPNVADLSYRFFIEPGSEMATFLVSWNNLQSRLFLELESPEGQRITPRSDDQEQYMDRQSPYLSYQINNPVSWEWTLVLKPEQISNGTEFRTYVFSQHPRISGELSSDSHLYKLGDIVPLLLEVYFERPLTGLTVIGLAHVPGGGVMPLEFNDEGYETHGDEVALDGVYSALFHATNSPGVYTFEVLAQSDGSSVSYAEVSELLYPDEVFTYDPIPPFQRWFRLTVIIIP